MKRCPNCDTQREADSLFGVQCVERDFHKVNDGSYFSASMKKEESFSPN